MTSQQTTAEIIAGAKFKPNSEPQRQFLASRADSTLYGGAAGGGKTMGLLMQAARHIGVKGYTSVIFRETSPQIRQAGGLWDTAREMYRLAGAVPNETRMEFVFPSGAKIGFGYVEHDRDLENWAGSQIAMIGFDQLEVFSRRQFFFMQSRNRSMCGVIPRIYATCNPDPDCFLRSFIDWWIGDDGYPIEERSGVIRHYIIDNDNEVWGDPDELRERYGADAGIQSFTFIPAKLTDNADLMRVNPQYYARLQGLPRVERERLLLGNWNVRWSAGDIFKRAWFEVIDVPPSSFVDAVRYWDRAASIPSESNGHGSWTVGVKMGIDHRGQFWVLDVDRFQGSPLMVEQRIRNIASQDGSYCRIGIEQDPGQAGKAEAEGHVRGLAGYNVLANAVRESKGMRAAPFSAQCEAGNVKIVRAGWNDAYLRELENFDGSDRCASDQVDASSGAFHVLTAMKRGVSFVASFGRGVNVG